jgi:uncharacterized protein YbjT (DUF2867 family)
MILITGAAGFVGRHVVGRLMAEKRPIRCLLPDFQLRNLPWNPIAPGAPEFVVGNVLNEEALFRAVTGVHTIIHLENAQWWGRSRQLERIEVVGTRNLIVAARSARVGRIITLSHLGATPASAYTLLRIKGLVEEAIRGSGLAYTIIRSGIIFGEDDAFINHIAMMLQTSPLVYLMPGHGETAVHPIYIDDLVTALALSLELIETVDTVLEIGGPEYISLEDLIHTVMRVMGTYRMIVPVPPYLMRSFTGIYSRVLPRSLMTSQWLDVLAANRTAKLGNTYNYFGFHPRRLEDTLLTYLPGQNLLWPAVRYALRRRPRGI